ncbi:antibiotic biosynthesis monooxygenase [Pseudonocardia sp. NPDC049635]|uniref:putative quinol monooxygenase n=1 Tax=Pseudonocardia sp. NPDC049635 TaxID=3155506 RepID=UPI003407A8FB
MAFVVMATWRAKAGKAHVIEEVLRKVTPVNRTEPKMLEFQAHTDHQDPATFVLYEKYTDASGYDDHKQTDTFRTLVLGEAIPNLEERSVRTMMTLD